jgi:hypothetical protein
VYHPGNVTKKDQQRFEKYKREIDGVRNVLPQNHQYLGDDIILRALFAKRMDSDKSIKLLQELIKGRKNYPNFFPKKAPSLHYCQDIFDSGAIGLPRNANTSKHQKIVYQFQTMEYNKV